jgi:hypothetical protein
MLPASAWPSTSSGCPCPLLPYGTRSTARAAAMRLSAAVSAALRARLTTVPAWPAVREERRPTRPALEGSSRKREGRGQSTGTGS